MHELRERLSRPREANRNGVLVDAEHVGDLGVREILEAECDYLTVARGESTDRVEQVLATLGQGRVLGGIRVWIGNANRFVERFIAGPSLTPIREGPIVCDAIDERTLRTFATERRKRTPEREKNVLKEVLALLRIALVGRGETPKGGAMSAHNALEVLFVGHP